MGCAVKRIKLLEAAGLLALAGSFALAEDVRCPETISVKQRLAKPEQGWQEGIADMPIRLAGVTFYDGPPEQKASLVYDGKRRLKGRRIATWRFGPQSRIWISCGYAGTTIVLSRPLAGGVSECSVTYDPGQTVAGLPSIEKMDCK